MAFYAGCVIVPTLILLYFVLTDVVPYLTSEQMEELRPVFFWSFGLLVAFPLIGVLLILRRIRLLEQLAKEVKTGSAATMSSLIDLEGENEVKTLHTIFMCLQRELREKIEELNSYGQKIMTQNNHLSELATTDPLTGCYNRRCFDSRIAEEMTRARRYQSNFSIIMLDIDDFKIYNDTFGHQAGDQALQELVMAIKQSIRDSDLLFRYGGDEFIIVCPNTDMQGAHTLAGRICETVRESALPAKSAGSWLSAALTFSCGVVDYAHCDGDMVAAVDQHLYQEKSMRKGKKTEGPNRRGKMVRGAAAKGMIS